MEHSQCSPPFDGRSILGNGLQNLHKKVKGIEKEATLTRDDKKDRLKSKNYILFLLGRRRANEPNGNCKG
jgi:hypothetical protein